MPNLDIQNIENSEHEAKEAVRSSILTEFTNIAPSWIVRKGISLFFIITVLLVLGTWFIQYPETLKAKAKLHVENPPKEILARPGRLIKLLKKEGDQVELGEIIGFLETTANHNEILDLEKLITKIKENAENGALESIPNFWNEAKNSYTHLGELQAAHQNFMQSFLTFKNYLNSGFYNNKRQLLYKDIETQKRLYGNLLEQQNLQHQEFNFAKKNYETNKLLHKDSLINDFEMRELTGQWLSKKMTVPQMSSSLINAESQQTSIHKELMELDKQIVEQKNSFTQAVFTYYNLIYDWKNKNCIISPASGSIRFNSFIVENQPLEAGKAFCFITQESSNTIAIINIPTNSISKVKKGMALNLRFSAYPYQEYGSVKGIIDNIKEIPTDSGFITKIILPKGLITDRKKPISFSYGLEADCEIFIDNKRLLEKITEGLLKK